MNADAATVYKTGRQLALIVIVLLGANIAISVLAIFLDRGQLDLIGRIEAGGYYTLEEVERNDNLMSLTGLLQFSVFAMTAVFFLVWLHRVSMNLRGFDIEGLRYKPGWTVGWWFIPIFNLFRPYQAVSEAWRASLPPCDPEDTGFSWRLTRKTPLLPLWWGLWIVSSIIDSIVARVMYRAETPEEIIDATRMMFISDTLDIAPAVLLILLIRSINQRQRDTSHRLGLEINPAPVQLKEAAN